MIHYFKSSLLYCFIALLTACGYQEGLNTDKARINTALAATEVIANQATETTIIGTSPKRDLLASLAQTYPDGTLPPQLVAAAAVQRAQNPAILKYSAGSTDNTISTQSLSASPQAAGSYTVGLSAPVQRAQNTTLSGSYFFTIIPAEMTNALATNPTWNLEGTAFHASLGINPGLSPVYRFRNRLNGSYLYTIDEAEKNRIIANYSATFILEGPAWFASPAPAAGFSPLYRFQNLTNGTYLFTAYEAERNAIVANYASIFLLEGISYYVRQTAPLEISLLAGGGSGGSANGSGAAASFNYPEGIARDGAGNLYVTDYLNHTIRKITPEGLVTTLAGSPGVPGSTNGYGSSARFKYPVGIVYLPSISTLFVADSGNHTIRSVSLNGYVDTLSGTAGVSGSANGSFASATYFSPSGIAVSPDQSILIVTDAGSHTIRMLLSSGSVSTLAGLAGSSGSTNGAGSTARFTTPRGVAFDGASNVYVADWSNRLIRKITLAGNVTTLAGAVGPSAHVDGTGSAARFKNPWGLASDGGNNLYVAEDFSVRKVNVSGVVTTAVGTGVSGTFVPGLLPNLIGYANAVVIGGGKTYITTYNGTILQINGVP